MCNITVNSGALLVRKGALYRNSNSNLLKSKGCHLRMSSLRYNQICNMFLPPLPHHPPPCCYTLFLPFFSRFLHKLIILSYFLCCCHHCSCFRSCNANEMRQQVMVCWEAASKDMAHFGIQAILLKEWLHHCTSSVIV